MSTLISDTGLWICVDCTQYASGISESERGEDYPEEVSDGFEQLREDAYPAYAAVVISYDYDTFSTQRCDICLTALGGERYEANLLVSIPS